MEKEPQDRRVCQLAYEPRGLNWGWHSKLGTQGKEDGSMGHVLGVE